MEKWRNLRKLSQGSAQTMLQRTATTAIFIFKSQKG